MVLARNAVHSALFLVLMMLLPRRVLLRSRQAPFLGAGADHRLHRRDHDAVPVRADAGRPGRLRLARRDAARPAAAAASCSASASRCWSRAALDRALNDTRGRAGRRQRRRRQRQGIAELLFTRYLFAFEVTSALLITAAVGAMMLAHIEREPGEQREPAERDARRGSLRALPAADAGPGRASPPHTRSATPALLPDGRLRRRASAMLADPAAGRRAEPTAEVGAAPTARRR